MDLLQTVRKEGSRGGVNFSWDDVKNSQHRENYLGHSLMAPVGRWQKNKDLSWYAKADEAELTPEERAEREKERKNEEMRKVKEAEEDAMNRALGLPVPERNANEEPLGLGRDQQKEVSKALKEALDSGEDAGDERGVGYGTYGDGEGNGRMETTAMREQSRDGEDRGRGLETGTGSGDTAIGIMHDRVQGRETGGGDQGAEIAGELTIAIAEEAETTMTGRGVGTGTEDSDEAAVGPDRRTKEDGVGTTDNL